MFNIWDIAYIDNATLVSNSLIAINGFMFLDHTIF